MDKDEYNRSFKRFQKYLRTEPVVSLLNRNLSFLLNKGKIVDFVEVNDKMECYTDGKKIVLSGFPFLMSDEYDTRYWTVGLRVALAHEAQHDNSSDFEIIKENCEWYGKYLKDNFSINQKIGETLGQRILNCVEDGRVNNLVCQRFPGYVSMMRFCSYANIAGGDVWKAPGSNPEEELTDFLNNILAYSITGLDSPGFEVYAGTRMESEFNKIRGYIDDCVIAPTAHECFNNCKALETVSAEYIASLCNDMSNMADFMEQLAKLLENYAHSAGDRKEQKGDGSESGIRIKVPASNGEESEDGNGNGDGKDSDKSKDGKSGNGSGEPKKNENSEEKSNGKGSGSSSDKDSEKSESEGGKDGKDGSSSKSENKKNGSDGKSSNSTGKKSCGDGDNSDKAASELAKKDGPHSTEEVAGAGFSPKESPALTEQEITDMLKEAAEALSNEASYVKSTTVESTCKTPLNERDRASLNDIYGNVRLDEILMQPKNLILPPELAGPAKELHRKLQQILKQQRMRTANQHKGVMAPGSLWKLRIDNPDVFQRKGPPKEMDCVFYELVDRSGSMASSSYNGNRSVSKIFAALSTAAIIEEALKGIAKTKIVAFDAGCNEVQHVVIKDFNQREIGNRCFDALREVGANNGNKDGYSIRVAAMDIAKRPEKRKILIVLSDGLPSAYNYGGNEAENDVRKAVQFARRQGITVIPIMYGMGNDSSCLESYKFMYEKDIIATDPSNILKEFENLLPKLIK